MHVSQVQLKISLSEQLNDFLQAKAQRFGIPVTQLVKHMIIKEIEKDEYPTYQMSARTEQKMREAIEEEKTGKTVKVDTISHFFENL